MAYNYNRSSTDANQNLIVKGLRRFGAAVFITTCAKKFCDIVVAFDGVWYLFEIKDPNQPPSKRQLTPGEVEAKTKANAAKCEIHLVTTLEECIEILKQNNDENTHLQVII